ncbi:MAG: triacylglycerol lipase [Aliiglaciecola sp.]|uniref:lipase family alpha/beta hydrolase n=1 Tax=Aliiglaciecola sp. TaxID=1872441 RepID=UPI003296D9BF
MKLKSAYLLLLLISLLPFSAMSSSYTQTKYPIVLVHGLFGFDDVFGIDYFYRIPDSLSRDGAQVFIVSVSAANSSEVRGEQLLEQVEDILALTGAEKVNLIGHSHGGPTTRYVGSVMPELVASVTSVGGVNWGSPVADLMRNQIPPGALPESLVGSAVNSFASLIGIISGNSGLPQNSIDSLDSLTTAGSIAFNQKYPEGIPQSYCGQGTMLESNGVAYFSWSGTRPYTNFFDPVDGPLSLVSLLINEPNDGLVSACSSHLGYVIKDNYKMNHLDEVNQTLGIHHLFETDPITVYRKHANRLKNMGL